MSGKILKTAGKNSTKTAKTITLTATDGDINFRAKGAVKYSAKSDITYNAYKAPEQTEEKALTVKKVTGPETVEMGKTYTFKAILFSEPIKDPKVLENVKWAYQLDGEGIKEFPNPKGRIVGKTVVKKVTVNDDVWDNKKATIYAYFEAKEGEGKLEVDVKLDKIYVTTSKKKYLFSLEPNTKNEPEVITVKDLYKKGIQWFCPYADDYLKLIHCDKNLNTFSELKHFSWDTIVQFAEIDRWNINYRTGGSGDWKASKDGGDGYILITVGNFPYWGDGIGQIPFSVDVYTDNLEQGYSKAQAIRETLASGQKFGDGNIFGGSKDYSNSYDNHIIVRACLWAKERYEVKQYTEMMKFSMRTTYRLNKTSYAPDNLQKMLTKDEFETYLK